MPARKKYNEPVRNILIGSIPTAVQDRFKTACSAQNKIMRDVIFDLITEYISREDVRDSIRKRGQEMMQI